MTIKASGNLTITDALNQKEHQVSWYVSKFGKTKIDVILIGFVIELCDFIKSDISDNSIKILCEMIYCKIWHLGFPEVAVLFNHLKQCKYYKCNGSEIINHVDKWLIDRDSIAEMISIKKHKWKISDTKEYDVIQKWYENIKAGNIPKDHKDI